MISTPSSSGGRRPGSRRSRDEPMSKAFVKETDEVLKVKYREE